MTSPFDKYVVHVYQSGLKYDVYVGRGPCPKTKKRGSWGNKWSHKEGTIAEFKTETVEEAVAEHKAWVLSQPELVAKIKAELAGKTLACWCRTRKNPLAPCHALTLAEIANS